MAMSASSTESSSSPPHTRFRLRVTVEADPQSLARVLERFVNLDVTPRRIHAEFGIHNTMHIEVDVTGLSEDRMTLIAAKVGQATSVFNAFWHYL
jgi:hypothetical protein